MTLVRAGNELEGSYFYLKSGPASSLKLHGKIDAGGKFTMREFDSSAKQSGEFSGAWTDEPNEAGFSLAGQWKRPNATDGLDFFAIEQIILFTNGASVVSKQINESMTAQRFTVTVDYPQLNNGAGASLFNQLIRTRIGRDTADLKRELLPIINSNLASYPGADNLSYLTISYNTTYADNDLVSIKFLEHTFPIGAPHDDVRIVTITCNLKTGRALKLADLFNPTSKYLSTVASLVRAQLNSQSPEAADIFAAGRKPTVQNFKNWNFTRKGLMFGFDPMQVRDFASGPQYVILPYAKLKKFARVDGPLARFLR